MQHFIKDGNQNNNLLAKKQVSSPLGHLGWLRFLSYTFYATLPSQPPLL